MSTQFSGGEQRLVPLTILLNNEDDLRERIDAEALTHYVTAVHQTLEDYLDSQTTATVTAVQIGCALLPGGNHLVEVQWHSSAGNAAGGGSELELPADKHFEAGESTAGDTTELDKLQRRLESLAVPLVESGPVSFAIRLMRDPSDPDQLHRFTPPFLSYCWDRRQSLDEALMKAAGLPFRSDREETARGPFAWLGRWWRTFRQRLPATGRGRSADTVEAPTAEELKWLLQSSEAEERHLTEALERYPQCAALYKGRAKLRARDQRWDEADEDVTRYLESRPDDLEAYVLRGEVRCNGGHLQPGLSDFNEALRRDPEHVAARAGRGQVYLELSAWQAAEEDFSAALSAARHRSRLYLFRARARIAQLRPAAALEDLSSCLRVDPHHDEAYLLRAMLRRDMGPGDRDPGEVLAEIERDLEQAVRVGRSNPAAYVQRAELRLSEQRFEDAMADCDRAVALDPENGWAFGIRAIARRSVDRMEDALADCDEAERLGFRAAEVSFTRAIGHYNDGQSEAALLACGETLELDGEHPGAFTMSGMIHLERGELDEALDSLDQAAQLAPDSSEIYAHRGNVHRLREEPDLALADYNRAIELDGEAVNAYLNRALCLEDREEYDAALGDVTAVIEQNPQLVPAYDFRARLWSHKAAWDKVRSDLDEALRRDADYAPAYFNRGHLSLREGKYEEAKRDFDELLRLCPTLPAAYSSRGDALLRQGDHQQAEEDYREAIQLDPGSAEAYSLHRLLVEASYYHERSQFRDAIRCAGEALDRDEQCAAALEIRAAAYWYSEQLVEAVDDYTRLLELDGDALGARNGRGHALAELGEFEQALDDLDAAVRLAEPLEDPKAAAYALNGRGLALAGLERYEEAERAFARSLQACPDNGWAHYNRGRMLQQQGRSAEAADCFRRALECQSPALSPRKRRRAEAFADKH